MLNKIYRKMGINNLKNNKETFLPFIISSSVMIMMYFMMAQIKYNISEELFTGAISMNKILSLGIKVIALFSIIVIFYTNSFIFKKRKKELGLYSVLGLEKKHISYIFFHEVMASGLISIAAGIILGIVFSKFMFMVLLNLIKLDVPFRFAISIEAVLKTAILFAAIYLAIILFDSIKIGKVNAIEIIQESKAGEREPKVKWIPAVLGAALIGIAYYIAVTIENPVASIPAFAIAVILVIVGTYFAFMFTINAVLKAMKKSKNYYNKKSHFFVVSSMIYRMKQNAAGLASICILCTMVMVVASSGICLYAGMDDIIKERFKYDVVTNYMYNYGKDAEEFKQYEKSSYDPQLIADTFEKAADKYGVSIKEALGYYEFNFYYNNVGNSFNEIDYKSVNTSLEAISIMDIEDIKRCNDSKLGSGNSIEPLEEGEAYVYLPKGKAFSYDEIDLCGVKFKVKDAKEVEKIKDMIAVVPSLSDIEKINFLYNDSKYESELMNNSDGYGYASIQYNYLADIDGGEEAKLNFCNNLRDEINDAGVARVATVTDRYTTRQEFIGIYAGIFFVGIFLGVIFLMATAMIIYYKQLSEGYDDRERFTIMKKVGMSDDEAGRIIRYQVLLVFFIPIIFAVCHVAFAMRITTKLLSLLYMTNIALFIRCTVFVILIFVAVYMIMYFASAKAYKRVAVIDDK